MQNIEFYRPIRQEPDFKQAPSLEAAQKALEEYKLQLDRDTLWLCGTTFGLTDSVEGGPCGEFIRVSGTTLIQTHWYTPPSGCTEGDYWNAGEINLRCPGCGFRARWSTNDRRPPGEVWSRPTTPFPIATEAFAKKEDRYDD